MRSLIAFALFAAISLGSYGLAAAARERSTLRASLRQLTEYGGEPLAAHQVLDRTRRRPVVWLGALAARLGRAVTRAGYLDRLQHRLVLAGRGDDLDRFLALRLLGLALIPLSALICASLLPLPGKLRWVVFGLVALILVIGPDARLNRAAEGRRQAIRASLPEALDLLTISVEAGFGLEQGLDRVASDFSGPLADELGRLQGEMRAGATRAAALRTLTERVDVPELRSFVLAVIQADAFGVSIAPVLRDQSEEMRVRRRQFVQERAQKAPVKMLIPMVFCIFPALFVVVLGPAMLQIGQAFR
jgi:tight adherence protein C